jgi:phenylpyruvate tautomerase PptA (4-oxalocrotonate tautomerase family)
MNTRSLVAALVAPQVILTHGIPFLLRVRGSERSEAFLLGVLASLPLDWYVRRFVESHVTFEILNAVPVPNTGTDSLSMRVTEIAGRLAAVDDRYEEWAAEVSVPVGSVTDPEQKEDLIAELDAAVALLYGLDEGDVRVIFETFHEGWDYTSRLDAVLRHFRRLR